MQMAVVSQPEMTSFQNQATAGRSQLDCRTPAAMTGQNVNVSRRRPPDSVRINLYHEKNSLKIRSINNRYWNSVIPHPFAV